MEFAVTVAVAVAVAGGTFRYRGSVHGRFPDVPRWHAGLHEDDVLWGCREGDAYYLILDYRPISRAGSCRIELWKPAEAFDAPVAALLALGEERRDCGETRGDASLSGLVAEVVGVGAPA